MVESTGRFKKIKHFCLYIQYSGINPFNFLILLVSISNQPSTVKTLFITKFILQPPNDSILCPFNLWKKFWTAGRESNPTSANCCSHHWAAAVSSVGALWIYLFSSIYQLIEFLIIDRFWFLHWTCHCHILNQKCE